MGILILVLIAVAIIVMVIYHNQLQELRRDIAQVNGFLSGRIREIDARVGHLERRTGELTVQLSSMSTKPGVQEQQAPAPVFDPPHTVVVSEPEPPAPPVIVLIEGPPAFLINRQPEQHVEPQPTAVLNREDAVIPAPAASYQSDAKMPLDFVPVDVTAPTPLINQTVPEKHGVSLEERFGTNWLNKLGIGILVVGVAFFLAHQLSNMGPVGKALTGLICGGALLAGGMWLERKPTYRIFARAGIGGGWSLLFFTTFAMHHIEATKVIESIVLDLVLMLVVAAGMVLHSLRYRSQTVTGLAFLLGYATITTSHLEAASGTVIFSLSASAVLAFGLVVVTVKRHWAWLEFAGLVATIGTHFLWLSLVMPETGDHASFKFFAQSAGLIILYWVIFRAAYLIRTPVDSREERITHLTAVATSAGILGLFKYQSLHPEWTFRALLAMGVIEMLLGIWARRRRHSAFVVLSTIACILLIAAVPYQFHGVSWPVLWLAEAHVLALCGLRLGEPVFRRLGLLAGFAASVVLGIFDVLPLISSRLDHADLSQHVSLTIALTLAALLFWIHSEVYAKRWPETFAQFGEMEQYALSVTSWLGAASAVAAIWVVLPAAWFAAGCLTLVVLLGIVADRWSIESIALEADLLAACSVFALIAWNFAAWGPTQKLSSVIAIGLLYAGMRRRAVPGGAALYVAPVYSWTASIALASWLALALPGRWLSLSWALLAVVLYEIGRISSRRFFCWQGFAAAGAAFCAIELQRFATIVVSSVPNGWDAGVGLRLLTVLVVAGVGYWLQERASSENVDATRNLDGHACGLIAGAAATAIVASWIPDLWPTWGHSESSPLGWAIFSSVLMAVACLAQRKILAIHAIVMCLWTGLYGVFIAITSATSASESWWQGDLCRLGIAAAVLFFGLEFAFRLQKVLTEDAAWTALPVILKQPEQWFFFVPFGMMIVVLAAKLREGSITLAWSLLGVSVFLFALWVKQRTFRLGGISLLMLAVLKIVLMDIWTLGATDRYITLIALGCALLLVSFLYTRFPKTFRRYL